jgi:hypothetical protein
MRLYVCDRCHHKTPSMLDGIQFPSTSFFGQQLQFELCQPCLDELLKLVSKFLKEKINEETQGNTQIG